MKGHGRGVTRQGFAGSRPEGLEEKYSGHTGNQGKISRTATNRFSCRGPDPGRAIEMLGRLKTIAAGGACELVS